MTSHFRWYGSESQMVVPANRVYTYPAESNHAQKQMVKIYPKNKDTFTAGNEIRIELPVDGFMNTARSYLEFDATITYTPTQSEDFSIIRFQNNIYSVFERYRFTYGSTNYEDIEGVGRLARLLTTHTGTGQTGGIDQMSISEGVGGAAWGVSGAQGDTDGLESANHTMVNARQAYIQGISLQKSRLDVIPDTGASDAHKRNIMEKNKFAGNGFGPVPHWVTGGAGNPGVPIKVTRRYRVPILGGLTLMEKLLPLKFMGQILLQWTLGTDAAALFWQKGEYIAAADNSALTYVAASAPTFELSNVSMNCEILHFDATYSESFKDGLKKGVPIKFSTFTRHLHNMSSGSTQVYNIQDMSRSIKSVFTTITRDPPEITKDSGTFFSNTSSTVGSVLQEFQWKAGSRYYPAQPVQCASTVSGVLVSNGGAEAYSLLADALNIVGDQRLSTTSDSCNWISPRLTILGGGIAVAKYSTNISIFNEYDGKYASVGYLDNGTLRVYETESSSKITGTYFAGDALYEGRCVSGNLTSEQFVFAINFETSNGLEISGLNGLEQSDLSLTVKWSAAQNGSGFVVNTWVYKDVMMILFENNVVETVV